MLIFLDTNIYYKNWFTKSGDFNLLFNYINNSGSTLLVPEVVYEEVNNKYQQYKAEALSELEAKLKKVQELTKAKIEYFPESDLPDYDLREILEEKTISIDTFGYEDINQKEVVNRALKKIRPFQDEDKGYRDTLIWLSLLDYLKKRDYSGKVIFIDANKHDFYSSDGKTLHSDLVKDCEGVGLKCSFETFVKLEDFLEKHVPIEEHGHDREKIQNEYLDEMDAQVQNEIQEYLNGISTKDFNDVLISFNENFPLLDAADRHNFEIVEGIENPAIDEYKFLDKDTVFILYDFILRITEISFHLPPHSRSQDINWLHRYFLEIEESPFGLDLHDYPKAHVRASFNLKLSSRTINGLTLRDFKLKG